MAEIRCDCGTRLKIKDDNTAKALRCPKCKQLVRLPEPEEEEPADVEESQPVQRDSRRKSEKTEPEEKKDPRPKRRQEVEDRQAGEDDEPEPRTSKKSAPSSRRPAAKQGGGRVVLILGAVVLLPVLVCGGGAVAAYFYLMGAGPATVVSPVKVAAPPTDPNVAENFVLRPTFRLKKQSVIAGSAFAVKVDGFENPVILSALHLMGPAGGLGFDMPGTQVPAEVVELTVVDMFTRAKSLSMLQPGIPLPDTSPLGKPSPVGDVMAFWAPKGSQLSPSPLAQQGPKKGDYIWLAYSSPHNPTQRAHRAKVDRADAGAIEYLFEQAGIEIPGTSGAPLLNSAGEVVGIHLGGGKAGVATVGVANPVGAFRTALTEACRKNPPRAETVEVAKGKEFVSKAGRYTIMLPAQAGTPKETIKTLPSRDGPVTAFLLVAELPDKTALQVMVSQHGFSKGLKVSDQDRVAGAVDNLVASFKGEVVEEKEIALENVKGTSVVIKIGGTALARVRVFARQNRLYQVLALGPEQTPYTKEIDRFMESFRLLAK